MNRRLNGGRFLVFMEELGYSLAEKTNGSGPLIPGLNPGVPTKKNIGL